MEKDKVIFVVEVDDKKTNYKFKGTSGRVKLLIGELEFIKNRLLHDLEKTYDEGYI